MSCFLYFLWHIPPGSAVLHSSKMIESLMS
jgi:hypothetical protein